MTETLGPYKLLKKLAIGGMAEIFLAKKDGLVGFEKFVALKVMLPQKIGDPVSEKIMMDEARLTAQLQHDNIIQVHDLERDGDRVFMVMEYVRGHDLSALLAKLRQVNGLLAVEVAAYIAREVASGLHYAHSRSGTDGGPLNLVHRDITPQNLLLGVDGDVKIVDFGVAKVSGSGRIETQTGIIKGKLRYMAPEYAIGNLQDARSDIFALGLCLFEMITGRPAYDDESVPAEELVEKIKVADIQPPETMRKDVPPELSEIVMKALSAHPDARQQSAFELQESLTVYLSHASPGFTKAHFATYISRLFERLGIAPEIETNVNATGASTQDIEASRAAPVPQVSLDDEFGDDDFEDEATMLHTPSDIEDDDLETGALPGAETGRMESDDGIDETSESASVPVAEVKATPLEKTDEIELLEGGPDLNRVRRPPTGGIKRPEPPRLMTQSGFNRLIAPKAESEDRAAKVELGPPKLPELPKLSKPKLKKPEDPKTEPLRVEDLPEIAFEPIDEPLEIDGENVEALDNETPEESPKADEAPKDEAPKAEESPLGPADPDTVAVQTHLEPEPDTLPPDSPTVGLQIPADAPTDPVMAAFERQPQLDPPTEQVDSRNLPMPAQMPEDPPTAPIQIPQPDVSADFPVSTHPMTGAPTPDNDPDSSAMIPTNMGLGGVDSSGAFRASAHLMNEDSHDAGPPPPQPASTGMPNNLGPEMSGSFQAVSPDMSAGGIPTNLGADMSGSFQAVSEASSSPAAKSAQIKEFIETDKGRKTSTMMVAGVFLAILVALVIFAMMLPD